jgi:hypothetical protein
MSLVDQKEEAGEAFAVRKSSGAEEERFEKEDAGMVVVVAALGTAYHPEEEIDQVEGQSRVALDIGVVVHMDPQSLVEDFLETRAGQLLERLQEAGKLVSRVWLTAEIGITYVHLHIDSDRFLANSKLNISRIFSAV